MSTALDFIRGTITVSDGDSTAIISGATSELFDRGTAVFVMDGNSILPPVQATTGATATTVDLLRPWDQGSVSGAQFVAFNTIKGLVRLLREVNVLGNDLHVYADSFGELLTSTDPEVILELSGGDVTLTPWGYLKQKFETESNGLLNEVETDFKRIKDEFKTESSELLDEVEADSKRNKLLALAGIVL